MLHGFDWFIIEWFKTTTKKLNHYMVQKSPKEFLGLDIKKRLVVNRRAALRLRGH